jgi:hypothetical protein
LTDTPSPTPGAEPDEPGAPAGPAPRQRRLWAPLRGVLARYVRFWAGHRLLGCLGCLGVVALVLPLLLLTLRLGGGLLYRPVEREPLWPVERLEANEIGSVMNESADQVEEYIAGMREFDAQRMWSSYNEQIRNELTSRGRSPAELQRGLSQAQAGGARIDQAVRLGNYPLRDGRRYVFYVITRSGFPPDGGTEELYFVFTLDPNGKILSVT